MGAQIGPGEPGGGPYGLVQRRQPGRRVDHVTEGVDQHHRVGGPLGREPVQLHGPAPGRRRPVDAPLPLPGDPGTHPDDLDALAGLRRGVLAEPLRQPYRDRGEAGLRGAREHGHLGRLDAHGAAHGAARVVHVDVHRTERPAAPVQRRVAQRHRGRADDDLVEAQAGPQRDPGVEAHGLAVVGHRDAYGDRVALEAAPRLDGRRRLDAAGVGAGQGQGEQHQRCRRERQQPRPAGEQRGGQRHDGDGQQAQRALARPRAAGRRWRWLRRGGAPLQGADHRRARPGHGFRPGRGRGHDETAAVRRVVGVPTASTISRSTSSVDISRTHNSGRSDTRWARAGTARSLTSSGTT
ncbi:hypothetical protein STENM36S_01643 [Streptomyces tendae]